MPACRRRADYLAYPMRPTPTPASRLPPNKSGLHPRNRQRGRYDFAQLIGCSPELARFVARNAYGDDSIDFADPAAVRALNAALLKFNYGVDHWALPPQYLCPPIPGRADYVHYLADLLAERHGGEVPTGDAVRVLDVGVGANCIYPLIGHGEYGWHFVGFDIDRAALDCAQAMLDANPRFAEAIELRLQGNPRAIFRGMIGERERFHLTLCNPPFHASLAEARAGSERKWRNLGKDDPDAASPRLNFGGHGAELHCPGGEEGFIRRMIAESADYSEQCLWFSSLVSKATTLPVALRALRAAGAREHRVIDMAQGQKRSRILAWTYYDEDERRA
ncbi:23S rRNA (adenine(1618)-N(6))-methyltransferase RlmF [Niveibacterium sp.]|uniref:23S rRNA (adenine(1618)-N(6))-methyltransferase RlmF n=1 Tax=Niveibacterium sp. TaxID=2017444 RepID=UPI0035ADDBB3